MKKKISAIISMCIISLFLALPSMSSQIKYVTDESGTLSESEAESLENPGARLADMADILSDAQEAELLSALDETSKRQQMDIVIVTVKDLGGKSHMEYADDFYDYNGYGFGENKDGLLLLVKTESDGTYTSGNSWISTCGYGITAFTDDGIQYIGRQLTPDLTAEEYDIAFSQFVTLADEFITQARSEKPYDSGNLPKGKLPLVSNLLIALALGFAAAFLGICLMKGQLRSVRPQPSAADYIKKGSLAVTGQKELFLYSHVDSEKIEKDSDSSTHTSSSGSTHGGGF